MAKEKLIETLAAAPAPYEIQGLVISDFMPIKLGERQINLAKPTDDEVKLLSENRDKLPWLKWAE